jgi:hypothetical protein
MIKNLFYLTLIALLVIKISKAIPHTKITEEPLKIATNDPMVLNSNKAEEPRMMITTEDLSRFNTNKYIESPN